MEGNAFLNLIPLLPMCRWTQLPIAWHFLKGFCANQEVFDKYKKRIFTHSFQKLLGTKIQMLFVLGDKNLSIQFNVTGSKNEQYLADYLLIETYEIIPPHPALMSCPLRG